MNFGRITFFGRKKSVFQFIQFVRILGQISISLSGMGHFLGLF
jgi:hypothetical protein